MNLFQKFLAVFKAFDREQVDYVLIGGFAVILYGFPRLTQDLDILVNINHDNIKKIQKSLYDLFQDESVYEITIDELNKYAVIRYGSPEGFHVDIMAKVGEIADFNTVESRIIQVENVPICIATPESLFNMKKDSIRPEDQRDIEFLKEYIKGKK